MIVRYILKSTKIVESITLEYTAGIISSILMPVKHRLNVQQYDYLIAFIPFYEENIKGVEKLGSGLYVTKEVGPNVKIAMFCTHYMKAHDGLKYAATKQDGSRIKPFKVTDELLEHYFKSDNFLFRGKYSIANLTKYYNELIVDLNSKGKSKHPDQWSEAYENKLKSQQEVNEYWTHLRSQGLTPKKDRLGKTMDWIKEEKKSPG